MLSNRWPYAKRPRGLARLRYRKPSPETMSLLSHLMDRNCVVEVDDAKQLVLQNPVGREIIHNNGQHTFLIHSTTYANAQKVSAEGLSFQGAFMNPSVPDSQSIAMMLSGPQEENRLDLNVFGLVYRYAGHERSQIHENIAKLIIELPIAYLGTIYERDPFEHTPLSKPDGMMIIQESVKDNGQYRIPARYVKGYFHQTTGEYKPNPLFDL